MHIKGYESEGMSKSYFTFAIFGCSNSIYRQPSATSRCNKREIFMIGVILIAKEKEEP